MTQQLKKKQGLVVSKSGDKTIKVSVKTRKRHPFYKKVVNVTWSALVHDEDNSAKVGDSVSFVPCRPLSATKRWRLVSGDAS
ncbi:MAG: 30S ribosomal protein S17 [Candidatus Marinamargulisbacteria bacterium]